MSETPEMVQRVAEALRTACLEEFGSTWSYDRAWKFARAAIEAVREPTDDMVEAAIAPYRNGNTEQFNTIMRETVRGYWTAMINAALD